MAWSWTAATWRTASKQGKFWRSSEFNRIETAIGRYNPNAAVTKRLTDLKAILDAISAWRVTKQEDKGAVSPLTSGVGAKMAAREDTLVASKHVATGATLSVRSTVTDGLVRDIVKEVDLVMNQARSAWGGATFTDPGAHCHSDFRYLISAQSETRVAVEYRERTVKNPALIADAIISASVIDQDNVHLWGPSGFILAVPGKCIGAGFAGDVGTQNGVALGHDLEKYREMLRIYLQQRGGVTGLPAPTSLCRATGHNEVVVLGRSYGYTTSVAAIYVIVDEVADEVAAIRPVRIGRVAANVLNKKTRTMVPVVEMLDGVTAERMRQYRILELTHRLPIVQIVASTAVEINGQYWGNLHEGDNFRWPVPDDAVIHDSAEHRNLMANKADYQFTYFSGHASCAVCNPRA